MRKFHRLLKRQLKKAAFNEEELQKIAPFLEQIDAAYTSFDTDVHHIENILEKSSKELYQVNQQLKTNVAKITSQLTKVAGNIKEVIFEVDLLGNWTYINPAWEELMGYSIEDTLGKPYYAFIKDINGNLHQDLSEFRNPDFVSTRVHFETFTGEGTKKWIDVSIKCIRSKTNEMEGFIGTITDITDLKRTETALIQAKEKETQANRAKDDFLSTMSHEIRTPLNAVIGLSHLLLLEEPKKAQLENLHGLKYSSEHLLELINDILDFNKITSGSLELEDTDFSIDRILNGLQSIFLNKAKEKGIRFIIKRDNALPTMLMGDSTRITQILTNLINNAIKFTEQGKVVLDIELEEETAQNCLIRVEVKDTGIGIPEDKKDTIFQSFSQASTATTRKYGGTGLGLAICKQLLELMDTDITVDSIIGKGSSFTFILSLKKSTQESSTQEEEYTLESFNMADVEPLNGIEILVAEDNKLNILVIQKFLSKWNVNFEIAFDGEMAIEMASEKPYKLILMDLQMPNINGFDASKTIRTSKNSLNQETPIYALSASTGVDIKKKIKSYGIDGLLCKPFDPKVLYRTISKIVHQETSA